MIDQVRLHKLSVGKAAEECNLPLGEFLEILKKRNVDWVGYNEEDLERDLRHLKSETICKINSR